ncbi:hypothetical protein KJ639_01230 [Patescibacteria group bacterium]|nr:hypothetical protein [Patescibacteria group bacterium]
MDNKIKNLIKIFLVSFIAFSFFVAPAFASAAVDLGCFNNEGIKMLQIGNFTDTPGSTNWQNYSISADAGEVVILLVHYHNFTANEIAKNVKIKTSFPSGSSSVHTASISLWADNSAVFSDSANINISSSQTLSFITGSVLNYPKGGAGISVAGSDIVSSSGLNIGDVNYGNEESGYLSFKLQVSSVQVPAPTPTPAPATGSRPLVSTRSATDITDSSASLRSGVNPNGLNTLTWFEWGISIDGLANETSRQVAGSGTSYINFLSGLFDLSPDIIYYFRPVAQNSAGISYGSTYSFKTKGESGGTAVNGTTVVTGTGSCIPIVTTKPAAFITKDSASLRALVNPNGRSTSGWFEYGKSYALTHRTESYHVGSGLVDTDLLKYLASLDVNTTYYFRAVAENNCGKAQGSILSFTTEAGPYVAPVPAPKVEPTPAPAPAHKPAPPKAGPTPAPACKPDLMAVEISASADKVGINEKFEYKIKYKNTGIADADNVLLKIELPKKIFFEEAKPCKYSFDDNVLFFKLGRVNKNESGEINIVARTSDDAKYGEELTATAALDFTNMAGVSQPNVSDSATITIEGFILGMYSSAALFFAKIPWWLILLILVLVSIFWARSGISKSLKKI